MKRIKEIFINMEKPQKIQFIVAASIALLLLIAGIASAFAWFSATVTGNDTAKGDVVETGSLSIVYTNGQELRGEDILPGWSETKTFTVENTGTVEATYNINWENLTNTFVNKQDLVLKLTSTNGGGTLEETQISDSGNHIGILTNITIAPGVTQTYTMTITYKNQNYDQSSDMGKELIGKIEVLDSSEEIELTGIATDVIIEKATEGNSEGLITIDQPQTGQTEALTEYRYSGSNDVVKNYVNFNNETWRIIGVFPTDDGTGNVENRIKIIREESIGNYSWDTSVSTINSDWEINQWGSSGSYEGADLMKLLNPGYEGESVNNSLYWNRGSGSCYNDVENTTTACDFSSTGLTENAKQMIEDAVWYTSASNFDITASWSYAEEREDTTRDFSSEDGVTRTTNWTGKVGLMYPSDYGFASSECYSDTSLYNYHNESCTSTNWLYTNDEQWLLAPFNLDRRYVRFVTSSGSVYNNRAVYTFSARPVIYLSSSVKITGGNGTLSSPYELLSNGQF